MDRTSSALASGSNRSPRRLVARLRARRATRRSPPVFLVVPAVLAAGAAALPLGYLLVRAIDAGTEALGRAWAPSTLEILVNSVVLTVLVVAGTVVLGVAFAWLTTRTDLPARRFWAVATALPLVVPSFVAGYAFIGALGPRGMLQSVLGLERLPSIYGLFGATLVLVLISYPYVLLTVRGALQGLDPSLEEASRSLGRSSGETFRRVTLPLLRPAIGAGSLLVALYVLSDFGAVSLLRYDSFTRAIYTSYQAGFDRLSAVVLALVLVLFTVVLLWVEARFRGRAAQHRTGSGAGREPRIIHLGRWRWPAVGLCATVVALAMGVPLGVMAYWLARGVAAGEPLRLAGETWAAAWNSLTWSGLAALAAVALAVPVAAISVRYRSRASVLLERATYIGYAVPGVVIALALVFLGARYGGALYQTLPLLILAYVVLFLPQAVGAARASMLQVPPSVEEAGRSLGHSGLGVLLRVTTPMVRPGLITGGALVLLTAMKELPATLLLGPTGERTLATLVWDATREAFFARAAAPALVLMLLAGIPMAVLLHRRGFGFT